MIGSAQGCSACPVILASRKILDAVHCGVHRDGADSSSPRKRGPIRRAVDRVDGVGGLVDPSRHCIELPGLWVPAFAGTTLMDSRSAANTGPPSRGTICPRFACHSPSNEGAGNAGCALHPRSRVRSRAKKAAHEHTGQRRTSDIPCAMALRLISRSPRSIGLFSPPSPCGNRHSGPVGLLCLRKT